MFDPNAQPALVEAYLSHSLGDPVEFIRAEKLEQSTRQAPWRLDARVNGDERSFVLQLDPKGMEYEYQALQAVETFPIPTPRPYGLDLEGEALGVASFFSDFIDGESLLAPVLAGEKWAEDLYLNSVCQLTAIAEGDLGAFASQMNRESAGDVLEDAHRYLKDQSLPLADAAYHKLKAASPKLPALHFSNGDLWLDNFIVKDKKLSGVIDFANAGFSDPVYEFLLSFFSQPELQGRGIEERFCRRLGVDPALLHWYHGLEYFDTLRWVLLTGEAFVHHTAESLKQDLARWLEADHP